MGVYQMSSNVTEPSEVVLPLPRPTEVEEARFQPPGPTKAKKGQYAMNAATVGALSLEVTDPCDRGAEGTRRQSRPALPARIVEELIAEASARLGAGWSARPRPRRLSPREQSAGLGFAPMRLPRRPARDYSQADLAAAAEMFLKLKRGEDQRDEKVQSIREALEREEYENALKVEVAVERLLAELDN